MRRLFCSSCCCEKTVLTLHANLNYQRHNSEEALIELPQILKTTPVSTAKFSRNPWPPPTSAAYQPRPEGASLDLATSCAHPGTIGTWMANFGQQRTACQKGVEPNMKKLHVIPLNSLEFRNQCCISKPTLEWKNLRVCQTFLSNFRRITTSSPHLRMGCFVQPCCYAHSRPASWQKNIQPY